MATVATPRWSGGGARHALLVLLALLAGCHPPPADGLRITRHRQGAGLPGGVSSWQATEQCLQSVDGSPSVGAVEALRGPRLRQRAEHAARTGRGKLQVMFYHVRKAGGTSLRTFLVNSASRRPGVNLRMLEGLSMDQAALQHPSSVFVTHLREPMSRIASSFRYDFLISEYKPSASHLLQDPKASIESVSAWSAWMARVQRRRGCGSFLWEEPSNYYVKAFSAWGRGAAMKRECAQSAHSPNATRAHLEKAKAVLAGFDAILLAQWLTSPELTKSAIQTVIPWLAGSQAEFPWAKKTAAKGAMLQGLCPNSRIPEAVMQTLEEWNRLDIELYDWAQRFAKCRMRTAGCGIENYQGAWDPCM